MNCNIRTECDLNNEKECQSKLQEFCDIFQLHYSFVKNLIDVEKTTSIEKAWTLAVRLGILER